MTAPAETVTVVIPTYRRPEILARTLDAFLNVDFPPGRLELVVVDDSGGDRATEDVVSARQEHHIQLRCLVQENSGAAAARNHGARETQSDLLLFCDDDIIVAADHLNRHLATHLRFGSCCVMGWRDFSPEAMDELRATAFGRYWLGVVAEWEGAVRESGVAPGEESLGQGCVAAQDLASYDLSVPASLFKELGGFDEAFPSGTLEDHEFCLRARAAGLLLVRNNDIHVLHDHATTSVRTAGRRESVRAGAAVVLAQKHPSRADSIAVVRQNEPVRRAGGPAQMLKAAVKGVLSRRATLGLLHRLVDALEAAGVPDSRLAGLYRTILALHIHRGVREGRLRSRP